MLHCGYDKYFYFIITFAFTSCKLKLLYILQSEVFYEKIYKPLSIILITTLLIGNISIVAKAADYTFQTKSNAVSISNETNAIDWKGWALDVLWYFAKRLDSGMFSRDPIRSITNQRIELTTGSIKYNSEDVGGSSYIDIEAISATNSVYMDITLKASTNFLNSFTDTIGVTLTKPDGTYGINQQLGHNGLVAFDIKNSSALGTYRATFAENDSTKWDCGVILYNYNVSNTSAMNYSEGIITNDHTRFYLIPSANRDNVSIMRGSSTYSVDALYNQFYDSNQDDFVYSLKDLSINDVAYVNDIIDEIYYDAEHDRTVFEFITQFGIAKWPFDGDLTSIYHKGDNINLKFIIVSEYSTETIEFENLDYFNKAYAKLNDDSIVLDINDYIIK